MAEYDVLIQGGTVVDGSRTPRFMGDVGIKDGKIAKIEPNGKLNPSDAKKTLDANGLVVAPALLISIPTTMPRLTGTPTSRCPAGTGSPRLCSATVDLVSLR